MVGMEIMHVYGRTFVGGSFVQYHFARVCMVSSQKQECIKNYGEKKGGELAWALIFR